MNAVSLKDTLHQPRIAWAVSSVPLPTPTIASQRPVSVITSSNTTPVSPGLC
jgi:hypothetical protein